MSSRAPSAASSLATSAGARSDSRSTRSRQVSAAPGTGAASGWACQASSRTRAVNPRPSTPRSPGIAGRREHQLGRGARPPPRRRAPRPGRQPPARAAERHRAERLPVPGPRLAGRRRSLSLPGSEAAARRNRCVARDLRHLWRKRGLGLWLRLGFRFEFNEAAAPAPPPWPPLRVAPAAGAGAAAPRLGRGQHRRGPEAEHAQKHHQEARVFGGASGSSCRPCRAML